MPSKKIKPKKQKSVQSKKAAPKKATLKRPVKKAAQSKAVATKKKKPVQKLKSKTVAKAKPKKAVQSVKAKIAKPVKKIIAKTQKAATKTVAKSVVRQKPVLKLVPPLVIPASMTHLGTMGIPPYEEKIGEDYMNHEHRDHFQKLLNRWKQELMEEVDRTVHHMQDESANFPDPNDRATQEEEFSLELRARDRERKLIKKINDALQRMEQDDYGYCDTCGIEIGIRRLEARPTATLCIDCKTLDEIKERQMGGVTVE